MIRFDNTYYQKKFDQLAPHYRISDFLSFGMAEYYRKQAIQKTSIIENSHIIDLMCGTGNNAPIILNEPKNNIRYTGIDFSKQMILCAVSKYKNTPKISFLQCNLFESIPLPTKANHILCTYGLKCINPLMYKAFVKKINTMTDDNGTISIVEFQFSNSCFFRFLFKFYLNTLFRLGCLVTFRSMIPVNALLNTISSRIDIVLLEELFLQEGFDVIIEKKCMGSVILIYGKKRPCKKLDKV